VSNKVNTINQENLEAERLRREYEKLNIEYSSNQMYSSKEWLKSYGLRGQFILKFYNLEVCLPVD